MDEARYEALAGDVFARIDHAFRDVDVDQVDCERVGDVLTLTMPNRQRCVVNTQRPTRQIWLAALARGYHFSFDTDRACWIDDKDPSRELYSTLAGIVHDLTGLNVAFDP